MYHQSSSSSSDFSEDESHNNVKNRSKQRHRHYQRSRSCSSLSSYSSSSSSSTSVSDSNSSTFSESEDSREDKSLHSTRSRNDKRSTRYTKEDEFEEIDSYGRSKGKRFKKSSYHSSRSPSTSPEQSRSKRSRNGSASPSSPDRKTSSYQTSTYTLMTKKSQIGKFTSQKVEKLNPPKPLVDCITLPSYYNRKAINTKKYAEQIRKRKLLWKKDVNDDFSGEKNNQLGHFWEKATLGHDQDGKKTEKFKRLMGIKSANQGDQKSQGSENEMIKQQEEMFHSMESQYKAARLATHTHRGVGLGFGSFQS